jgi:hypothetical protein
MFNKHSIIYNRRYVLISATDSVIKQQSGIPTSQAHFSAMLPLNVIENPKLWRWSAAPPVILLVPRFAKFGKLVQHLQYGAREIPRTDCKD